LWRPRPEQKNLRSSTASWKGDGNLATRRVALTHGMFVTGTPTPRAYIAATLDHNLRDGIAEKISCPTLVLDAEEDMFFKGQPEKLYDHLIGPKTLMRFSVAEGAGAHCRDVLYSHFRPVRPLPYQSLNPAMRDATHVLDGLLFHESDLRIEEHYTDTAGFTDHVFALCHLLGFRFAPRILDRYSQALLRTKISFRRLNRAVSKQT
jgi:hypothetical protein